MIKKDLLNLSQVRLVLSQKNHSVTCRFAKSDTNAAAVPPLNLHERIKDRYRVLQAKGVVDEFYTDLDGLTGAWNSVRLDDSLAVATTENVIVGSGVKWTAETRSSVLRSIAATSFGLNVFLLVLLSGLLLLLAGVSMNEFSGLGYAVSFASIFVAARLVFSSLRKLNLRAARSGLKLHINAEGTALASILLIGGFAVFREDLNILIYAGNAATLAAVFCRVFAMKKLSFLVGSKIARDALSSGITTALKFCAIWITSILVLYTLGMAPESTAWLRAFVLGGGAIVVLSSFIGAFNQGLSSLQYDLSARGRTQAQESTGVSDSGLKRAA